MASGGQESAGAGRYAPSPSGDLHVGNLRTAMLAWLFARHTGRSFRLRIDDIDAQRSSEQVARCQVEDLAALGINHDGQIVRQQESLQLYASALQKLQDQGLVYECYCSRRDIQEASRAPHVIPGRYPGTCRNLSDAQREQRRAELAQAGRVPALRLRAGIAEFTVTETFAADAHQQYTSEVDDLVLRRGGNANQVDGTEYAYNLAVVVDDAAAGIDQVVRGDDLLSSAPRQAYLAQLLGLPPVEYVHVPLVFGPDGQRLAKRDGAVTMRECGAGAVLSWIGESFGGAVSGRTPAAWLRSFQPNLLSKELVIFRAATV